MKKKYLLEAAAVAIWLLMVCLIGSSHAYEWFVWETSDGGNGHRYAAVSGFDGLTWDMADQLAQAEGGYLATITSEDENNFIFNLIDSPEFWTVGTNGAGPALGGLQEDNAIEPDGGWYWTTGEEWTYSNWYPGSPDNFPGGPPEERLHFFSGADGIRASLWNDIGYGETNLGGFVIEAGPVPEPSTLLLMGIGLTVLFAVRKRKK